MVQTVFLLVSFLTVALCQDNCLRRDYNHGGTVCVCNSDHCDTVTKPEQLPSSQYLVYTSDKSGARFQKAVGTFTSSANTVNKIIIDRSQKYQTIQGWGGAMTDAAAINIQSLDVNLQKTLMDAYFSENGIEYSVVRVPIAGTDYSTRGYSYDDGEADPSLANFALVEEDLQNKIPLIKQAQDIAGGTLKLFASAWMAPKWMKTNGDYFGLGYIIKEMYQSWADYFVKFLDAYKSEGIDFWAITTGNEPNAALVPFGKVPAVAWTSSDMGTWIAENLGPAITASQHATKIIIFDDQRPLLPGWVDDALANSTARQYVDGIAVHWYLKSFAPASVLTETHEHFPEMFLLSTEACNGVEIGIGPVVLGSWRRGEDYAVDIIDNLNNWVGGWIDWNMVLDTSGGPTFTGNNVDAPIIVNATGGEFYKQPMYYCLGHFSKFIPPGSVRISSESSYAVLVVAVERPDNGTAVVILNRNLMEVQISIIDEDRGVVPLDLTPDSITTVLYW